MFLTRWLSLAPVALLACYQAAAPAVAQDWPTHPLTLVVPWAAGGGTDVMGRIMAKHMSETLGQTVVVENIAGAGGMIGSNHVVHARPDGYTFVFASRSDAIDMTLYKHPMYNLLTDLAPVVLVADQPTVLVARKNLPVDGLQSFISYAKAQANTIRLGSAGIGSTGGIDCGLFDRLVGIGNIQEIPYRGSGPAMEDLIGRHFDYFCTISGSAAGPLQNNLVKGIAVFRHDRLPSVPNMPTSFEQGVNFEGSTWFAFFAPKGTPPAAIKKLHDASVAAMEMPSVQEQLAVNGAYVVAHQKRSTAYLQSIVGPEIERNGAPLKAAGISIQ
jgi:tripartite-type tricarboxylate transporter receptor subunit TctC